MGIKVEEAVALMSDEVMTCARPTPGYADAVGKLEGSFQRGVVDGCDAVDSEANSEDDQGGGEGVRCRVRGRCCEEGGDVDVAVVWPGVDAEGGGVVGSC